MKGDKKENTPRKREKVFKKGRKKLQEGKQKDTVRGIISSIWIFIEWPCIARFESGSLVSSSAKTFIIMSMRSGTTLNLRENFKVPKR